MMNNFIKSKDLYGLENLYYELTKAHPFVIKPLEKQNDIFDKASNFIYKTTTFVETKFKAEQNNVDLVYLMHRWYNFHTYVNCEKLMCFLQEQYIRKLN